MEESISKNIVRGAIITIAFFMLTPITIAATFVPLLATIDAKLPEPTPRHAPILSALPPKSSTYDISIEPADARVEIVRQYLEKYDSPLVTHAHILVSTAEKYDLDFRLLTAIAQQESNLCKFIPEGGYNCWGWGIHKRGTLGFESFDEAIETVSKGLRENYLNKGLITPEEIMSKYTPSSPGTWARGVTQFMEEME